MRFFSFLAVLNFYIISAFALDISVSPSIGVGQANVDFNFKNDPVKADHDYMFVDLGLNTSIGNKYYITVATSLPIDSQNYNVNYSNYINLEGVKVNIDYEFKRNDLLIVFGHRINESISIFTGYRRSNIENSSTINEVINETETKYPNNEESIIEDGLLIGSQYTYPVKTWGLLGVKAAVAFMRAKYSIKSQYLYPNELNNKVEIYGHSIGLTYGLAWYGKLDFISNDLIYSLALDGYQFDYEISNNDKKTFDLDDMETNYLSYKATLIYRF